MAHPSKVKGDRFEALVRDYLTTTGLPVERIPAGASDDMGDLWTPGSTVQVKNRARLDLPGWWRDTARQRDNNGHVYGFLVHKRVGVVDPAQQWVTVDLATAALIMKEIAP